MESKINKRTRIKVSWHTFKVMRDESPLPFVSVDGFVVRFQTEAGLKWTTGRFDTDGYKYYFRIVDEHKYMLAKIKYGI